MNRLLRGMLATVFAASTLGGIASAASVPFTWDPAQAVPALPGSAFTADTMHTLMYLHSFGSPTGAFDRQFIIDINEFRLGGQPVAAPGFNSAYDLYFLVHASGQGTTFHTASFIMMADPTNDNGIPVSSLTGISFSNPAGVADDFVLGTGTLHSASITPNPITGLPDSQAIYYFSPAPGQEGFFGLIAPFLQVFHVTPPPALQVFPQPDGSVIALVNGAIGRAILIPEPSSLVLLAGGLLGLGVVRRLRSRRNRLVPI